ncbi:hypothetical protein [Streptacidiphilus cavernicola]|uniref:Uncharacterized protein n=1 Tax=Streptacidiphilus cavernicola TaxID=3342716 RepID=A0ABV6VPD0_9ACTN
MKITMHNGRPVVALTGWDLAVVTEALGAHVAQAGGQARRAAVLLASMEALDSANKRDACTCGSREHHPADCPAAGRRLRAVGPADGETARRRTRRSLR